MDSNWRVTPSLPTPYTLLTPASGSFHVSLLAGRILLKDFCYRSSNQTFKIVKVELRWQYWIRSLARSEDIQDQGDGEEPKCAPTSSFLPPIRIIHSAILAGHASQLPRCRFHATLEGFEWFIYNRTSAFDYIISQMDSKTPVPERRTQSFSADGAATQLRQMFAKSPAGGDRAYGLLSVSMMPQNNCPSNLVDNVQTPHMRNPFSTPRFLRTFGRWLRGQLPSFDFKGLLPFSFEGINGGIVCGNMATSNILIAEFSRADGIFGTVPVRRLAILCCVVPPIDSHP
jgi:hypothetical protein